MVVSADTLRLAIVPETTPGVTPSTPAWQILRTTGEGLTYNPSATFSNEMDATRGVRDSILTGGEVGGDINFELSYNDAFMYCMPGVFCSDWGQLPSGLNPATTLPHFGVDNTVDRTVGANDLFTGDEQKTFTIEKRFSLDGGGYAYHRYNGCFFNTFSLTVTPNEPIGGSFGIVGRGMTLHTSEIAGSSYASPGVNPVFTALKVSTLNMLVAGSANDITFNDYCINGITVNITNNARRTACIGPTTFAQTVLGRCEVTIDANIYFADNRLLQWLLDQTDINFQLVMNDTDQPNINKFHINCLRCKVQSGSVVASGTGQDVIANATFAALIPASPAGMTPIVFSREQNAV